MDDTTSLQKWSQITVEFYLISFFDSLQKAGGGGEFFNFRLFSQNGMIYFKYLSKNFHWKIIWEDVIHSRSLLDLRPVYGADGELCFLHMIIIKFNLIS